MLSNWQATYLLRQPETADAVEDKKAKGWYRHQTVLTGTTERAIRDEIRSRSGIPIAIRRIRPPHPLFSRVSRDYKQRLLLALNFNVAAGMSAGQALIAVIEAETGRERALLDHALKTLRTGGTFPEAIASTGLFDESTQAILDAGDRTGSIRSAIASAAEHYQAQGKTLKLMFGAVIAIFLDLLIAVITIIGNRVSFLPMMEETAPKGNSIEVEKFKAGIELAYWVNDILIAGTVLLFATVLVGIYGYMQREGELKNRVDRVLRIIPLLKDIFIHSAFANTCKIMASLLSGGVVFKTAASIVAKSVQLPYVKSYWKNSVRLLDGGYDVRHSLNQPAMSNSERLILLSHQDHDQLAKAMTHIAAGREQLAERAAKRFGITMFIATMLYTTIAVMFTLWIIYLQSGTLTIGLGS